jgi:hypothetical protein
LPPPSSRSSLASRSSSSPSFPLLHMELREAEGLEDELPAVTFAVVPSPIEELGPPAVALLLLWPIAGVPDELLL